MAITLFYFLLYMFCQFLLHHRASGLGFIHKKNHIWQICWWCQPWLHAWWTAPNLAVAQLLLISRLKPLCVPQAHRLISQSIFAIQNDKCDAAVCGENRVYKEREGPLKQVTTIVPFTEGSWNYNKTTKRENTKRCKSISVTSAWNPHMKWQ